MGERILRPGIRSSDRTAALIKSGGWMAQVFYDWLITVVDDYGRYDARPGILRTVVFPLLLDQVREADVQRCLAACEKAGLIRLYTAENKPFLELLDFRQRLRAKTSKWPAPTACHDNVVTMPTETETETETQAQNSRAGLAEGFEDQAKKQSDAHHFAKNWVNSRFMGSKWCDNSSIRAMGMLVNLIGKERAVSEVDLAATDPEIVNPMTTVWSRYDPMRRQRKEQMPVKPYKPVTKWQEGVLPDGQKQRLAHPPKAVG